MPDCVIAEICASVGISLPNYCTRLQDDHALALKRLSDERALALKQSSDQIEALKRSLQVRSAQLHSVREAC